KLTVSSALYDAGTHAPAINHVAAALREGGHAVSRLFVPDDIKAVIKGLTRRKPDLVFHLINEFGGECGLVATAAILDALRLPFTGGGPGELFIRGNKS